MQVLSSLVEKAAEHSAITGFKVHPQGREVTHLQFADDTLFFLGAEQNQVQMLQDILLVFGLCSGLQVNFAKSVIYPVSK